MSPSLRLRSVTAWRLLAGLACALGCAAHAQFPTVQTNAFLYRTNVNGNLCQAPFDSLVVDAMLSPDANGLPSGFPSFFVSLTRGLDSNTPLFAAPGTVQSLQVTIGNGKAYYTASMSEPDLASFNQAGSPPKTTEVVTFAAHSGTVAHFTSSISHPSHGNPVLWIPDRLGQATNALHLNWIALTGCTLPSLIPGTAPHPARAGSLVLTKLADRTSAGWMVDCTSDTIFSNLVMDGTLVVSSNRLAWYHLTLGAAWLSEVQYAGISPTSLTEKLVLQPLGRFSWSYTEFPGTNDLDTFATWYDFSNGHGGSNALMTVTALQNVGSNSCTVSWPAVEGATYQIQSASAPGGPYSTVAIYTATTTGPVSQQISTTAPVGFFRVQLPPD